MNDIASLVFMKSSLKGLQLHECQSNRTRAVGCCGDQAITRQWSARDQTDAQAQRHRSLGNHAEVRWVEALPAAGFTYRKYSLQSILCDAPFR